MFELCHLRGDSYFIQSPARVGVVKMDESRVCLIDSGSDKDAARRIRKTVEGEGWKIDRVLNTHANADHIGGNKYLADNTGCKLYAPGTDCAIARHPILEPACLFGAYPPKELRHKFLLAQPSPTEYLTKEVLPEGMELLPLPGHYFDMVGFRTADGVVYLADCLSSRETLDKYRITYIYDVAAYLDTLERVCQMEAEIFVPAHAQPTEDIAPLARYNIQAVEDIAADVLERCREGKIFEELLAELFVSYELRQDFEQYALVGSSLKSYLVWLLEGGKLQADFHEGHLVWKSI